MEKYPDLIFNLYQRIGNDHEYDYEFVDQCKYQDLKINDFSFTYKDVKIPIDYCKFLQNCGYKLEIDKNQQFVKDLEPLAKHYKFEQRRYDPLYRILNMDY